MAEDVTLKEVSSKVRTMTSNVYSKLSDARARLKNLKPTGENKYSDYMYFELKDFLPKIMEVNADLRLCSFVDFDEQVARLVILDADYPEERIVFNSPMKEASVKGCQPIQNLGAIQTYQRRYLYMMAYEIAESDVLNNAQGKHEEEDIVKLTTEWGSLRSQMTSLAIDYRSEEIKQRIANETGYASQEMDGDPIHVAKTITAYKKIIEEHSQSKQSPYVNETLLRDDIVRLKNECISKGINIDNGKTYNWIIKSAKINTTDERKLTGQDLVNLCAAFKEALKQWDEVYGQEKV